jgi:hypothetical protein
MQPRAVRVPLLETVVRFNGQDASLVNISRSGALLRMFEPVEIGADARLTLSQRSTTIEIDGKVVRARGGGGAAIEPDEHHVGVSFGSPPPPEVTALLRRLIART